MQSTFEPPSWQATTLCILIAFHAAHTSIIYRTHLLSTALDDGRWAILVLDASTASTASLNTLHHAVRSGVAIWDLAEDDVAAIEPRGDHGGDEELGAVGVGAGVGHGQHEGLLVGELEVLVCEFLAVDGFAARALNISSERSNKKWVGEVNIRYRE